MMEDIYARIMWLLDRSMYDSVAELCRAAGVSSRVVYDLKSGKTKTLNTATAQRLASALYVSVDRLLGPQPLDLMDLYTALEDIPEAQRIVRLVAKMDKNQRREAEKQIVSYALQEGIA